MSVLNIISYLMPHRALHCGGNNVTFSKDETCFQLLISAFSDIKIYLTGMYVYRATCRGDGVLL